AILVLTRRVLEKDYLIRLRLSHVLFGLLGILAAISTVWAADKFAAAVTAAHLIAAAALFWSTTQLVRSWLRLRLVAGICFGLLLACLTHAIIYKFVEAPETLEYWNQHKAEILKQRGLEPDSFHAHQLEKKILNQE